jgi:hypothetical protein
MVGRTEGVWKSEAISHSGVALRLPREIEPSATGPDAVAAYLTGLASAVHRATSAGYFSSDGTVGAAGVGDADSASLLRHSSA